MPSGPDTVHCLIEEERDTLLLYNTNYLEDEEAYYVIYSCALLSSTVSSHAISI